MSFASFEERLWVLMRGAFAQAGRGGVQRPRCRAAADRRRGIALSICSNKMFNRLPPNNTRPLQQPLRFTRTTTTRPFDPPPSTSGPRPTQDKTALAAERAWLLEELQRAREATLERDGALAGQEVQADVLRMEIGALEGELRRARQELGACEAGRREVRPPRVRGVVPRLRKWRRASSCSNGDVVGGEERASYFVLEPPCVAGRHKPHACCVLLEGASKTRSRPRCVFFVIETGARVPRSGGSLLCFLLARTEHTRNSRRSLTRLPRFLPAACSPPCFPPFLPRL